MSCVACRSHIIHDQWPLRAKRMGFMLCESSAFCGGDRLHTLHSSRESCGCVCTNVLCTMYTSLCMYIAVCWPYLASKPTGVCPPRAHNVRLPFCQCRRARFVCVLVLVEYIRMYTTHNNTANARMCDNIETLHANRTVVVVVGRCNMRAVERDDDRTACKRAATFREQTSPAGDAAMHRRMAGVSVGIVVLATRHEPIVNYMFRTMSHHSRDDD